MEADFSGYATKAGLKCSDGRTITPEAFKHQDKMTVPLVWQHGHNDPKNVLGHAVLEARSDGVYAYGYFNQTEQGKGAKQLVEHKDVTALSIWANNLVEKSKQVLHGAIREVSLVLSGANPGALIDQVRIVHSDGDVEVAAEEAIIYTGLPLEHENQSNANVNSEEKVVDEKPNLQEVVKNSEEAHAAEVVVDDKNDEVVEHAGLTGTSTDPTPQEVYDNFSQVEKDIVAYMIGAALEAASTASAQHSDSSSENDLNHQEGNEMTTTHNVFESTDAKDAGPSLSHDQLKTIMDDANRLGSLKESFLQHAAEYGIEDIDFLFPDAKTVTNSPDFISRRMEWVQSVLSGTKHSPFSRIKSVQADITADEARAKGYVKGSLKKDEVIKLLRRVTTPKTIYKKQKLDRDDILDITDLDVVAWLKAEMRIMLEEEIARAVLIGDGRASDDEDKIDEDHIRPIAYDVDMYNTTVAVPDNATPSQKIEVIARALNNYKGSGTPTFYTTRAELTDMLLDKDTLGRRFYSTVGELAAALQVKDIVTVDAMDEASDLVGVIVNLADYTIGADAGGNISMFDDFDIDYNQNKYLIETRISGALTKPKSSVTLTKNAADIVTPAAPTFVTGTGVLTVPSTTGVVYTNADTGTTLTAGAQTAIASGATVDVEAVPAAGYGFTHDATTEWSFTRS